LIVKQLFLNLASSQTSSVANVVGADPTDLQLASAGEIVLAVSGVTATDIGASVFASDDATLTFSGVGNTLIGRVIGIDGTKAIVMCDTEPAAGIGSRGTVTKAATGAITLTPNDCDKIILLPSTGAQAITLPAAADCAGRYLSFKKTTADAVAATLTRAGSDTIDGATTVATIDAANDTITIVSDGGTAWYIVAQKIA
jgi:formylmethanofuran dehydrogenase subunit E-like metal-binding protein